MLKSFYRILGLSLIGLIFFSGCVSPELSSGRLYMNQKEWEKAEESLMTALGNEPENAEIPARLGDVYGQLQNWNKMNEMFDLALSVNKDLVLYSYNISVENFVKAKRQEYWVPIAQQAVENFNNYLNETTDDTEAALATSVEQFKLAQKIDPSNPQAFSRLSNIYLIKGYLENAKKQILIALELDNTDYWAMMTAARIYRSEGEFAKAIEYATKATDADSANTTAVRLLAELYYKEGMIEDATNAFLKAIDGTEDKKEKADLYFNLGLLFQESDDLEKAEQYFSFAYELNPDDAEALLGMAHTFERAEKWRTAERYYGYLLDLDPENPEYNRGKAIALMQQGQPDRAQRYFKKYKEAVEE